MYVNVSLLSGILYLFLYLLISTSPELRRYAEVHQSTGPGTETNIVIFLKLL